MAQAPSAAPEARGLARAAGGAVLWTAGSTLVCDAMQFATMLVLVRLLSPADYGRMALAQTILGFLSVLTFNTFAPHALQLRDPRRVDWQAHFTAAAAVNSCAFVLTLVMAGLLSRTAKYAGAALPLAVLSTVFLVQVPAILRQTMVQAEHDWARTRGLIVAGALLSNVTAVGIALAGGGIWALIVGPVLNVAPAAADLLLVAKWRPDWSWSWPRYRETAGFGLARAGSAGVLSGRQAVEQAMLAGTFSFSTLGLFSRSLGLATLVGGRIGGLASASLYPVITRAERGSARFRRLAGLVLRGVAWTTIPASMFLALSAANISAFLYGARWAGIIPLLPLAAAQAALAGLCWAAYTLLMANNEIRACFAIDLASAGIGATIVFWLVPSGPRTYLLGLAGMYLFILGAIVFLLRKTGGIGLRETAAALAPPLVAGAMAAGALTALRALAPALEPLPLRLSLEAAVFALVFAAAFRLLFPGLLREFLEVIPGGRRTALVLRFANV